MRQAYHAEPAVKAQAGLQALARELDRTHPGAAASLREGTVETLSVRARARRPRWRARSAPRTPSSP
jgi:hypothetical protein